MATLPLLIDETAGVQSYTNELDIATFRSQALYASLYTSTGAPLAAAATTVSNVAQATTSFTGGATSSEGIYGSVDSVSFSLTDAALVDTGLRTLDGKAILLRSLGLVNGSYVFIGYVDANASGGFDAGEKAALSIAFTPIFTSGKVSGYTTTFTLYDVPIRHTNSSGSHVSYLDMNQLITRNTLLEVKYSDYGQIKSGQNAYIALKEPAGSSAGGALSYDLLFTAGSSSQTVNTSSTGAGVNNQTMDFGETLRVDYVTNIKTTSGKDLTTLSYGNHFMVDSGFFQVTQTSPTGGSVTVKVSLFDVSGDPQGTSFSASTSSSGYAAVAPTGARVFDVTGIQRTAGVSFNVSGNVINIAGVRAGDRVVVQGARPFDRMEITNNVSSSYSFDIGYVGGALDDGSSTVLPAFRIYDNEIGSPNGGSLPITAIRQQVNETTIGIAATASYASSFNASLAADVDGIVVAGYSLKLASEGIDSGLYDLNPALPTSKGSALYLYTNPLDGAIEAKLSSGDSKVYFRISVDAAGAVKLLQSLPLWHSDPTNPNDGQTLVLAANTLRLTATAIDGDQSSRLLVADLSNGCFSFLDDAPTITQADSTAPLQFALNEATFSTDATQSFAALINNIVSVNYGNDGPASNALSGFKLVLPSANISSGLYAVDPNAANGKGSLILLSQPVAGGAIQGTAAGVVYFEIRVDAGTGAVTFDQKKNVWHPDPLSSSEVVSLNGLPANSILLQSTATDADGDSALISVDLSKIATFTISDASPIGTLAVQSTTVPLLIGQQVSGTVTVNPGNDGFAGFVSVSVPPNFTTIDGRVVSSSVVANTTSTLTIKGQSKEADGSFKDFYTLTATQTGYTFTVHQPLPSLTNLLDFSKVSASGPQETYTLSPGGLSVVFDGIKQAFTDTQTSASTFNAKTAFDPLLANSGGVDDINPSSLGFGIGNGNIDIGEAVKLNTPVDSIIGYDMNVVAVGGGIGSVNFCYQAFNASGAMVGSGKQAVNFRTTPSAKVRLLAENKSFTSMYVYTQGMDSNDVFRIASIQALDVRNSPDIVLPFAFAAQDGDRDRSNVSAFTVTMDNGLSGF